MVKNARGSDSTSRAIWATKLSLLGLGATALIQAVIFLATNSTALLADTLHNLENMASAIPLWIAFAVSRREETTTFPYGYHKAEDLAGLVVLLLILLSAVVVGFESMRRLLSGEVPHNLGIVAVAGIIGFIGNESVAILRIRVGKKIGSAALQADGYHARLDGLTSLAVVAGAVGVTFGFPWADPVIGLVIAGVILYTLFKSAGPLILSRILDKIDPSLLIEIRQVTEKVRGVLGVYDVRARWVGHRLLAEVSITVEDTMTVSEGHVVAEEVHHELLHHIPNLYRCLVHVEPHEARDEHNLQISLHHLHGEDDALPLDVHGHEHKE